MTNQTSKLEHKILAEHTKQLGNLVRGVREVAEYANEIAKSCTVAIEEANKAVVQMLEDQNKRLDERFAALHEHSFEVKDALISYILLSTQPDATDEQKAMWFSSVNKLMTEGASNESTSVTTNDTDDVTDAELILPTSGGTTDVYSGNGESTGVVQDTST